MKTRSIIAVLVAMMAQAVLFGLGLVTVLSTPLKTYAEVLIPAVTLVTLPLSAWLGWWLAPRLRSRFLREQVERERMERFRKAHSAT